MTRGKEEFKAKRKEWRMSYLLLEVHGQVENVQEEVAVEGGAPGLVVASDVAVASRLDDELLRPEEGLKLGVVVLLLDAAARVGRRPQLHGVRRHLEGLDAPREDGDEGDRVDEDHHGPPGDG